MFFKALNKCGSIVTPNFLNDIRIMGKISNVCNSIDDKAITLNSVSFVRASKIKWL